MTIPMKVLIRLQDKEQPNVPPPKNMQDDLSKKSQNQKEIKNTHDQSLSSVHHLNSKDSSTHIESQSLDSKETLTLSQTVQTAKEVQDLSQNPNRQKVSKTSTNTSPS